ncbi:hypothetical protein O3P69_001600 [Scylla paramamosain]|uniref:Uncharacterized protein n=1 Tax=Scylla paramamosain TaxID=85552 RepID=A0AAW0UYF8_SCYPA
MHDAGKQISFMTLVKNIPFQASAKECCVDCGRKKVWLLVSRSFLSHRKLLADLYTCSSSRCRRVSCAGERPVCSQVGGAMLQALTSGRAKWRVCLQPVLGVLLLYKCPKPADSTSVLSSPGCIAVCMTCMSLPINKFVTTIIYVK